MTISDESRSVGERMLLANRSGSETAFVTGWAYKLAQRGKGYDEGERYDEGEQPLPSYTDGRPRSGLVIPLPFPEHVTTDYLSTPHSPDYWFQLSSVKALVKSSIKIDVRELDLQLLYRSRPIPDKTIIRFAASHTLLVFDNSVLYRKKAAT
jgi:hypothetical protein